MELTPAEREWQASWAALARLAQLRGAGAALPGNFPQDVEAEYQRLRAEMEKLRGGPIHPPAHERIRADAHHLLRRLEAG